MRIEAYTQVQQVYQSQRAGKSRRSAESGPRDDVQISSFGKEFQSAKTAVQGSPDIREELTAPIKAEIEKGTYEVSSMDFADKLINKSKER